MASARGSARSKAGAAPHSSCGAALSTRRSTRSAEAALELAQRLHDLRRIVRTVEREEGKEVLAERHAVHAAHGDAGLSDRARELRAHAGLVAALDAHAVDGLRALETGFLRCSGHLRAL